MLLELQVPREHKGQLVHRVPKVVRVFKGQQDSLDFKVQQGQLVRPALPGFKVLRELSVLLVFKDRPVLLVPQVRQDRLV